MLVKNVNQFGKYVSFQFRWQGNIAKFLSQLETDGFQITNTNNILIAVNPIVYNCSLRIYKTNAIRATKKAVIYLEQFIEKLD